MWLSSTTSIDSVMTKAIGGFLQGIFSLVAISWVIGLLMLVGVVALITWVVKKVWNSEGNKSTKTNKPKAHNQWTNDWIQNAQARQNNRYEYTDPIQFRKGEKWSPTGWYWDDKKGKWIPPDYMNSKPNTNMREPLTPEERELAKQIRIDRSHPTFEEWKAAQMKKPPDGAYHYDYIHIPNNETITEVKILRPDKTASVEPEVKSIPKEPEKKENKYEPVKEDSTQANMYEARPILTQNEARNYRTLLEAATRKGYTVNIKPRLADIATPRNKDKQYMANFRRISQKHVDFVILDANMKVRAVVELDDSSHDTEKGKKRDAFVDTVLKDCGYKIIHTRYIWIDILDDI